MTRLNASYRDEIFNNAVKDAFTKEHERFLGRGNELFLKIFESLTTKEERELLDKIGQEWLDLRNSFNVAVGGWIVGIKTSHHHPDKWHWGRIYVTDENLIKEVQKYAKEKEELRNKENAARHALKAMLNAARTFEQLELQWPEGKEYWKDVLDYAKEIKPDRLVPSLDVKTINEALGLPKDEAAKKGVQANG